jgi:O6-methylguanine-DNA--protein-cysteine methyltransferase
VTNPVIVCGHRTSGRTPRQRLKDVLAALPAGQTVASTELARTAEVALSTARAFLRKPGLRVTAVLAEPVGPGLPVWDDFVAALHGLAEHEKYAGIPIRVGWSARSAGGRAPRQRLRDAVAALPAGETVGPTELARRAGVARPTARAFLREQGLRVTAVLAGPVGPGLPAWNEFVAAVHKLATDKKYAGITIRLTED